MKPIIKRAFSTAATISLALAGSSLLPNAAMADTLFDNLNGISISADGTIERFGAMVVDDEGRISELLDFGDEPQGEIEYREDLQGRVVMPSFVDGHAHLMDIGLNTLILDLSDTQSLEEALGRISAYAAAHPDRSWILGRGWNEEKWGLGRLPTAADLEALNIARPIWLSRNDGHAGWANGAAMQTAGVTARSSSPDGGRIERLESSRQPSGIFTDKAQDLIEAHIPPPLAEDKQMALYNAQNLLLANGVTALADMGTTTDNWMTYRRAGDAGWLQIRIMAYATSVEEMLLIGGTGPTQWLYADRLRLNGVKLFLDGALGSRGALLKADYADEAGHRGLTQTSGTQLRNIISRAALDNFQVAIHAIGDAANQEALYALTELGADYAGDRRWRIEHAQIIDPVDIELFGQAGIIASMQPIHQTSDRLTAEARLGADRLTGAYAWKSISGTGAMLAFGSDAPVEGLNPFAGIAAAISRQDANGEPIGGWQPQEIISRESALAAYTAGAAYAGFAEGRFGSLSEGERADFIVLERDPLISSVEQIRNMQVLQTWIAGRKVYESNPDRSRE